MSYNCGCPVVNSPVSGGDEEICEGESNPLLSVTVGTGESANWYDVMTGGTILAGGTNTLTFTSPEPLPGVYNYYVETFLLSDPSCISTVRTLVTFTIKVSPMANPAFLTECALDNTGIASFDLTQAEGL